MNEVFQDDHLAHGGICFAWGLAGCHLDWVPWDWPEQKMRKGATEEIWKNFHQRDMKGVSFPVRRPGKVKRKWRKHKLRKICFMELDEKDTEGHLRTWLRWAHLGGVGEEEREGGDEHTSVSFSFSPGIRQMFGACGQHMSAYFHRHSSNITVEELHLQVLVSRRDSGEGEQGGNHGWAGNTQPGNGM